MGVKLPLLLGIVFGVLAVAVVAAFLYLYTSKGARASEKEVTLRKVSLPPSSTFVHVRNGRRLAAGNVTVRRVEVPLRLGTAARIPRAASQAPTFLPVARHCKTTQVTADDMRPPRNSASHASRSVVSSPSWSSGTSSHYPQARLHALPQQDSEADLSYQQHQQGLDQPNDSDAQGRMLWSDSLPDPLTTARFASDRSDPPLALNPHFIQAGDFPSSFTVQFPPAQHQQLPPVTVHMVNTEPVAHPLQYLAAAPSQFAYSAPSQPWPTAPLSQTVTVRTIGRVGARRRKIARAAMSRPVVSPPNINRRVAFGTTTPLQPTLDRLGSIRLGHSGLVRDTVKPRICKRRIRRQSAGTAIVINTSPLPAAGEPAPAFATIPPGYQWHWQPDPAPLPAVQEHSAASYHFGPQLPPCPSPAPLEPVQIPMLSAAGGSFGSGGSLPASHVAHGAPVVSAGLGRRSGPHQSYEQFLIHPSAHDQRGPFVEAFTAPEEVLSQPEVEYDSASGSDRVTAESPEAIVLDRCNKAFSHTRPVDMLKQLSEYAPRQVAERQVRFF